MYSSYKMVTTRRVIRHSLNVLTWLHQRGQDVHVTFSLSVSLQGYGETAVFPEFCLWKWWRLIVHDWQLASKLPKKFEISWSCKMESYQEQEKNNIAMKNNNAKFGVSTLKNRPEGGMFCFLLEPARNMRTYV